MNEPNEANERTRETQETQYIRTQCRIVTNTDASVLVDVVASVRVAGHVLLVHRDRYDQDKYVATYAPCGLGAGSRDSIQEAIASVTYRESDISAAIDSAMRCMRVDYKVDLAPETGIQTVMDWRMREQWRFDNGDYAAVPDLGLGLEFPADHYLHLSVTKTETDYVAYTPSEEYGKRDRQVRIKIGKYLKKTFPHLTDSDVQRARERMLSTLERANAKPELKFASDRQTISDIFETEMYARYSYSTSCMFNKFTHRTVRPYHVYADSPDVAVAYVVDKGEIVARSVVSTKDRAWIRAYSVRSGDATLCDMLINMLADAGYSPEGSLEGNRLTNLGENCVPYLDGGDHGIRESRCGKWWIVCEDGEGEYIANQTDGTAEGTEPRCERCGHDEDDCQCTYCSCCEESYADGCDQCNMCDQCDSCITHDGCVCNRCTECHELVEPNSRYAERCRCTRCDECSELVDDCECPKCRTCHKVEADCECEPEADAADEPAETDETETTNEMETETTCA